MQARDALLQVFKLLPVLFSYEMQALGPEETLKAHSDWMHTYLDFGQHCHTALHVPWSQALDRVCMLSQGVSVHVLEYLIMLLLLPANAAVMCGQEAVQSHGDARQ